MGDQPNLIYIKNLSAGDIAFEAKFIGILKDEFPLEHSEYTRHITRSELIPAAEMVHKLKHKFNILGMEQAYQLAVVYEEALRVGETKMHLDFEVILNNVQTYLNTI